MTDKSSFLKLPEIVMDNVLYHCNYMEIASLRKTCRSLREFVDTAKPDGRVDKLMIDCDAYKGKLLLQLGEKTIEIAYTKTMDGCGIFDTGNWLWSRLLKGEDHMELLKNDFSVLLRHQKSLMQEMEINGEPADIEQVLNILKAHSENPKTRKFPLKTTKLSLIDLSAPQILLALSSVDSQSLRFLSISSNKQNVLLDQITETEQWRRLDLNDIKITVTTAFLNSPNFSSCKIHYDSIDIDIAATFGVDGDDGDKWFFRMPNDESRVLYLDVESHEYVDIGYQDTAKVPTGAVIIR
ncbi:hypothetical protein GCK72_021399 [Caenorhabditis remanei]|uniref:F-box domain-containing protein n=1 Tax=Caenorhabditis remanei TaxID=31234 RepID=A0A6A5GJB9_CAERE|nr:hypothetical protein GCK72_021399 [Caenorhabditis remanei]KAF1754834.1 hypothetical protein GCK72_021399 [Caenorhabditis remanei]